METVKEPIITPKQIKEILKVVGYSVVFSMLLLVIILAILSRTINFSQLFNSKDSSAFFENLKSLQKK